MKRVSFALGALLVWIFMSSAAFADELILNGGFESGVFSPWSISNPVGELFCAVSGPRPNRPFPGHTGTYGAFCGPIVGFSVLSQTVATVPGARYDLSFWLREEDRYPPEGNALHLLWDGRLLASLTDEAPFDWSLLYFPGLIATGTSTVVQFEFWNPAGVWNFDDISVTTVPEPASLLLLGSGLIGAVSAARRKRG